MISLMLSSCKGAMVQGLGIAPEPALSAAGLSLRDGCDEPQAALPAGKQPVPAPECRRTALDTQP